MHQSISNSSFTPKPGHFLPASFVTKGLAQQPRVALNHNTKQEPRPTSGVRVAVAGVCQSPMKGLGCQAGGTASSQLGVVTCRADAPESNGLAVARMMTGKVVAVPPGVDGVAVCPPSSQTQQMALTFPLAHSNPLIFFTAPRI